MVIRRLAEDDHRCRKTSMPSRRPMIPPARMTGTQMNKCLVDDTAIFEYDGINDKSVFG